MGALVAAVGLLLLGLGAASALAPVALAARLVAWSDAAPLALAAGIRLAMAALLWLGAPACRHPTAVRVLGVLAGVGGVAMLAMGATRVRGLIRWWSERPAALLRGWGVVTACFGAALVYTAA